MTEETKPSTSRRLSRGSATSTTSIPATTPANTETKSETPAQTALPVETEKVEQVQQTSTVERPSPALSIEGLDLVQAGDVPEEDMNYMILVYGDSGAGKTHFASNTDGVLVVLLEPQGFATIRAANPKATVLVVKPDDEAGDRPKVSAMDKVRKIIQAAASGRLKAQGVQTIVIDSATELQQYMIDEIQAEKRRASAPAQAVQGRMLGRQGAEQSKPVDAPKEKGPAPEMTKQDWGTLAIKWRNFMRALRALPHHVVVVALSERVNDEATNRMMFFPKLSGSAQAALPAYFNVVGYIYKATVEGEVVRVVLVDGDDRYYTKSHGPVKGIAEADLRSWLAALKGDDVSVKAEGVRAPGAGRRLASNATQQQEAE